MNTRTAAVIKYYRSLSVEQLASELASLQCKTDTESATRIQLIRKYTKAGK